MSLGNLISSGLVTSTAQNNASPVLVTIFRNSDDLSIRFTNFGVLSIEIYIHCDNNNLSTGG